MSVVQTVATLLDNVTNQVTALSMAKIGASVVLLMVVLAASTLIAKRGWVTPEQSRKIIHVALGGYSLTFPWIFTHVWEVLATVTLALGVFTLARGVFRSRLGEGLHSVERQSYGEVLFAVSVALLFSLQEGHYITVSQHGSTPWGPLLYVLPLAMLTVCDAASALVGAEYGRKTFTVETGRKSWEGVIVFVLTGWLVSMIAYLVFTDVGRSEVILVSFIAAAFGTLLEAASWRGMDNLFIPLGLYIVLAKFSYFGVASLAVVSLLFLFALLLMMELTRRNNEYRHSIAALMILFFIIGTFSGLWSLLMPACAVLAYVIGARLYKPELSQFDPLSLVMVIVAIALSFFVISHMFQTDTIYSFNVAFGALAAGVFVRLGADRKLSAIAIVLVMLAMSVRIVVMENASREAILFFIVGSGVVIGVALLARHLRAQQMERPWVTLGTVSLLLSLILLPISPW